MPTATATPGTKKVTYMHGEIDIVRYKIREIQKEINTVSSERVLARTYRDSLVLESKLHLLKYEHASLLLRMYDLMEEMTYRQPEE